MDKYALMKRFHHDRWLQVYKYDLIYFYSETMLMDDHFPATETFAVNYKKMSTLGPVPKHWLGFSLIRSKDYELYMYFDET